MEGEEKGGGREKEGRGKKTYRSNLGPSSLYNIGWGEARLQQGCPGSGGRGEGAELAAMKEFSHQEIVDNKLTYLGLSGKMTPRHDSLYSP